MGRLALAVLLSSVVCAAQGAAAAQNDSRTRSRADGTSASSTITVPAWTSVPLALTRPVMNKTAADGEPIYAETVFPVTADNQMALPPGTYVEGQIDSFARPGWLAPHAQFQIHFTKIIFANGYTVELPTSRSKSPGQAAAIDRSVGVGAHTPDSDDVLAAVADPYIQVSSASDVLLDNGTQIQMILQRPLQLEARRVADAVSRASSQTLPDFKSATECRPVPATPGTPDTVIPGTPGIPGTPPTVIPGAPGTPPTVIPGTPGTPGTPPTVISGIPGTPGVACPAPPLVEPDAKGEKYKETFQVTAPFQIAGKQLKAGKYQASWQGLSHAAKVEIVQNRSVMAVTTAHVVFLSQKSAANSLATQPNPDGSVSLRSLRFAGQSFALFFSPGK